MNRIILSALTLLFFCTAKAQTYVTIGTQTWMDHNLQVTQYSNGDPIPQVTTAQMSSLTTGAWCYYNDDPATGPVYGKLYNWYAVHDPRGLAPLHWHVPSSSEWATLYNFLGGINIAGGKLKKRGTIWHSPNNTLNPDTYFDALPGGFCSYGNSIEQGVSANFWTSTSYDSLWAKAIYLFNNTHGVTSSNQKKLAGCSVRCIADRGWPVIIGK